MNNLDITLRDGGLVLEDAIEAFNRQTGIQLRIKGTDRAAENPVVDAIIEVEGYEGVRFAAEIKKWAQQKNIGTILEQLRRLPGKGMLVADYVNPVMADKMREMDIPFIDTAGNAYINEKPLYVFIKGNRQQKIKAAERRGRAFMPGGIKIIYVLLTQPELTNATYREIKDEAGVAIGTIGGVFDDLKTAGFLIETEKNKRWLKKRKRLLDRWVEAYIERLRPKQLVGRFTTNDEYWWKKTDLFEYNALWGGEVAAAKITDYLRPEKFTIYLPEKNGEALFRDKMFRKDEFGNIAVYRAFWKEKKDKNTRNNKDCVNPIIAYADLLATADVRNMEAARLIYDKEIDRLVDEY